MSFLLRNLAILLMFLAATPAAAGMEWTVIKTSQQVNYTIDKVNWLAVKQGGIVPNKAWISTGPRGRVQLGRGVERISMQPNTLAAIFTTGVLTRRTEVVQQMGVIDLDIEKRAQPHTYIQTPFLAAVVKGTSFRVSVIGTTASVAVERGLVQVTSFASGQRSDIGPGQSARVHQTDGMTVAGATGKPSISSVSPSVARVPARGTAKLNGYKESKSTNASDRSSNGQSGGAEKGKSGAHGQGHDGGNGNGNGGGNGGTGNGGGNGGTGNGGGNGNGNGAGNGNGGGSGNSNGKGNANGRNND